MDEISQFVIGLLLICVTTAATRGEEIDSDHNITSPNYPHPFGQHEEKTYTIFIRNRDKEKYLVAYFETFDILADPAHPGAVTLTIENHRGHVIGDYTDKAPPAIVTRVNRNGFTLKIRFKSKVSVPVNVTGFKMYFRRMNATEIEGNRTLSGASTGSITSPGYPLDYPIDSVYMYKVTTPLEDGIIQFEFQDLKLGEDAVIEIYDASTDGTPYLIYSFYQSEGVKWRYYLSGNVMTMVLKTKNHPTQRGFNLTYTEYCRIAGEELPCSMIPHSALTNVVIFVVSITGIIGFLFLLVGGNAFCRRFR